jgi:hypothetical protein
MFLATFKMIYLFLLSSACSCQGVIDSTFEIFGYFLPFWVSPQFLPKSLHCSGLFYWRFFVFCFCFVFVYFHFRDRKWQQTKQQMNARYTNICFSITMIIHRSKFYRDKHHNETITMIYLHLCLTFWSLRIRISPSATWRMQILKNA